MLTLSPRARFYAAGLAAAAGFVDAVGFLYTGGYFVSFMSGNTTTFAVRLSSLAQGAGLSASIILLFVSGVVVGALLARRLPDHRRGVLANLIAVLLAIAGLLALADYQKLALPLLPFAMGAMNTIFERNGEAPFGVTYMTGALVKTGQLLATALTGGPRWAWTAYAILWLGLASGAFVGALLYSAIGLNSLWAPVALLFILGNLSPA